MPDPGHRPRQKFNIMAIGQAGRLQYEAILLADRVIVLADGKIAEQLTIDLPRARDTGQPGFQAIRARLLTLLGVEPAALTVQRTPNVVRRFAHG